MTSIRKAALACVASAVLALPLSAAAQGPVNQDTFFTFSQDVELPNKTLPAGKYLFQLADSPSNRHIVKVMSADRKEIYATLLAIPYYSNDRPSDDPQVRFMETPASGTNGNTAAAGTNAIKIWFYPGNSVGHEFIYPRSQAMRIASRTGSSVLTTKSEDRNRSQRGRCRSHPRRSRRDGHGRQHRSADGDDSRGDAATGTDGQRDRPSRRRRSRR